jgi:TRAP-type C4-dicarboxylate transport system permease small subunit
MALMTLDVLWGVFTRYALGHQASWSEELARFLLIWIGLLGAAFASGRNLHLSIDLLLPRLSPARQHLLLQLVDLLVMAFALAVMVGGGIRLMYLTRVLGQSSPALQLPMWLVYSVLPLSGLLVVYYMAGNMWRRHRGLKAPGNAK